MRDEEGDPMAIYSFDTQHFHALAAVPPGITAVDPATV
jgi:hypothetical protein